MNADDRRIAEALQACIERVEAGATPSEALAEQPEALRGALALRLGAALTVRAHRPALAPMERAELQARILAAARPTRGSARWRPRLMRLAGAALAVLLLVGTLGVASANARPGQALYRFKQGFQWLRDTAGGFSEPVRRGVEPDAPPEATVEVQAPTATLPPAPTARPLADRGGAGSAAGASGAVNAGAAGSATDPGQNAPAADAAAPVLIEADPAAESAGRGLDREPQGPAAPATSAAAPLPTASPPPTASPTSPPTEAPAVEPDARPGAIEGMVRDDDGRPLYRARVEAIALPLRRWDPRRPQGPGAYTDREGRYRIEDLPPGNYLVLVRVGGQGRHEDSVYFPGTSDRDRAVPVAVGAGATVPAIDIRLERRERGGDPRPGGHPLDPREWPIWPRGRG